MKMPKVKECQVERCAYNQGKMCHALAITVGDDDEPRCDTFFENAEKGGERSGSAGVGACKVATCEHNQGFECHASAIQVGMMHDEAECLTFEPR